MNEKILVVDDEKEIADLIEVYLKNDGYTVYKYYNGTDALQCIGETTLDLAVLDIMLPDIDGFRICQKIREKYFYPIIMLTAKVEDGDKIMGLSVADDYITKPFSVSVLKIRLQNILRRKADSPEEEYKITSGDVTLDLRTFRVFCQGEELDLSMTEFRLLQFFMENKNRALLKEQILQRVWDVDGNYVEENTLSVNISRLRRKLGSDHIRTIQGIGYLWEEKA